MFLVFLCFLMVKSSISQKAGLATTRKVTYFYSFQKRDSTIAQLFTYADSLLKTVTVTDKLPPGSTIEKSVTLHTAFKCNAHGENFAYEKMYVVGKEYFQGAYRIFFLEEYPEDIGSLYEYGDDHIVALTVNQFLITTIRGYLIGKKMRATKNG
jgi:hypothetical protein